MRPGDHIGQYALVRYIGKGGMAEVWEARHLYLNKGRLALKFLLPQFATNHELQERFLKEAQRQLDHPNIIAALDFFQIDGLSYMVMRYVPPPDPNHGPESLEEKPKSLEDRLEEHRPMTVEEIRSISADLLSALDFAHSHGVVHRDVKPANVLLHRDGRSLLTDFGIAKGLREERSMTRIGTSLGTPDYMSPEQIRRPTEVDARSDIYSFGCVLYAMLSRNPPFGSEETTEYEIKDSHVRVTPPPLVYWNRNIPIAVEEVVFKCLEKDPNNRYPNCGAVMLALNAALDRPAPRQPSPHQPAPNQPAPNQPAPHQPAPNQPAPHPSAPQATPAQASKPAAPPPPENPKLPPAPQPSRPPETVTTPIPHRTGQGDPRVDLPPDPPAAPPTRPPLPTLKPAAQPAAQPGPKPPIPKSDPPPDPPPDPPTVKTEPAAKSGAGRLLAAAVAVLLLAAGGVVAWQSAHRTPESAAVNFATLSWDDPHLANCGDNPACLARKAQADQLTATNWQTIRFDSQLFADCMNYPQCLASRDRAKALTAVANWTSASPALLSNCMSLPDCESELQRRKPSLAAAPQPVAAKPIPARPVDPENLPSCCKDSPNPAQCKAQKKAAGIHGDCVLGH